MSDNDDLWLKCRFHAPILLGLLFDAHEVLAFALATPAAVIFC
jgi:hypothetical protein